MICVFVVNCVSRVHPFLKDESIQQSLVQSRKIETPIQSKPIKYVIYSRFMQNATSDKVLHSLLTEVSFGRF